MMVSFLEVIGRGLARYLSQPRKGGVHFAARPETLAATIRKGDVLFIEGTSRISAAIKYLSQSTWSHAALFIGDAVGPPQAGEEVRDLLEADVSEGVRAVPLSKYFGFNMRICRPVGLSQEETDAVVAYAVSRIGHTYEKGKGGSHRRKSSI